MKTFKVTLLAAALIIFTAGFASAAIIMTVESATIQVGEATTIDVSLSGITGTAYAFDFKIPYDIAALTASNLVAGPAVTGMTQGSLSIIGNQIIVGYFNAPVSNGVLASFDITGLTAGVYGLNLNPVGVYDSGGDDLIFTPVNGTLTVNPVPIPAAVWLLGSGLVGLIGLRRRMKK